VATLFFNEKLALSSQQKLRDGLCALGGLSTVQPNSLHKCIALS